MKRIRNLLTVGLGMITLFFRANDAWAQSAGDTNGTAITGQFAGLAKLAMKSEEGGTLPAKLSGLLWPDGGKHSYKIKKISMPVKNEDEERIFCLRTDNHDMVLVHRTDIKPNEDTKYRKEFYYRATINGDLVLALSASFRFEIDDVDNELLKELTFETYGESSGDGKKPQPLTTEIRDKFEAEKKYWFGVQKRLAKATRKKKSE